MFKIWTPARWGVFFFFLTHFFVVKLCLVFFVVYFFEHGLFEGCLWGFFFLGWGLGRGIFFVGLGLVAKKKTVIFLSH